MFRMRKYRLVWFGLKKKEILNALGSMSPFKLLISGEHGFR